MVQIDGSHLPRWRSRYRGSAKRFRDQQRNQSAKVSFLIFRCFSLYLRFQWWRTQEFVMAMHFRFSALSVFHTDHSTLLCVCLTLTTARRNSIFFPQTSLTSVSTTISVHRFCQKISENVKAGLRLSKRFQLERRYLGWLKRWPLCNWEADSACSSPPPDFKCFFGPLDFSL